MNVSSLSRSPLLQTSNATREAALFCSDITIVLLTSAVHGALSVSGHGAGRNPQESRGSSQDSAPKGHVYLGLGAHGDRRQRKEQQCDKDSISHDPSFSLLVGQTSVCPRHELWTDRLKSVPLIDYSDLAFAHRSKSLRRFAMISLALGIFMTSRSR